MSHRNKKSVKTDRRNSREVNSTDTIERQPVSELPLEVNTRLMCEFGTGDRASRGALLAARGSVVLIAKQHKRDHAIKNVLRLQKFTLVKLGRERSRTARRASTFMYAARKATLGSTLREKYESAQTGLLYYLQQVNAEIQSRLTVANHQIT